MTLRRIEAADAIVSLEEAKLHLRVEHDADDALIASLVAAATARAERYTGMAFGEQTWEQVLDTFPAAAIDLGLGPVVSVGFVRFIDSAGDEQDVDSAEYEIDTVSRDGWVVPSSDWPTPMDTINAVRVRFVVGTTPPADVRAAVLLMVGHWYANREAAGPAMQAIPIGAEALLDLHRRMFV